MRRTTANQVLMYLTSQYPGDLRPPSPATDIVRIGAILGPQRRGLFPRIAIHERAIVADQSSDLPLVFQQSQTLMQIRNLMVHGHT